MKRLFSVLALAMMLRVWFAMGDSTGVVFAEVPDNRVGTLLLVRDDKTGGIVQLGLNDITKSTWVDIQPTN
jgi:hypothetical protein